MTSVIGNTQLAKGKPGMDPTDADALDRHGPVDHFVALRDGELTLHVREWRPQDSNPQDSNPQGVTFVLVHGLASNAATWDAVAGSLSLAGCRVYALDQRGHGRSGKPESGFGFEEVTGDLALLLDELGVVNPIIVGQSWGGNVALAFGARYPDRAAGLAFVDGGFIDMQMRPDATWDKISKELRPPSLAGIPYEDMLGRMKHFHPDWSDAGIEGTMANFEVRPDGTIKPWLTLDRHMMILRALWEQRPRDLFGSVHAPVLIAVAGDRRNPERMEAKKAQVHAASAALPESKVVWFAETDHDIHVHRPDKLAALMLEELSTGIWSKHQSS